MIYRIKKNLPIVLIVLVAIFLRFYELSMLMTFIPDQGWFYLSARDMLLTGIIPLVGPPTSHPWIHHGPLWTYALAFFLWAGNYNPIFPAYFIAFLGSITVYVLYKVTKDIFGWRLAFVASILYATSPLIVMNSRIPYHTSPIPFFVIVLFYVTYKWVKGNAWFFPIITFLLALLYNHEITTFVYVIVVGIIFLYGVIAKKIWVVKTQNITIICTAVLSFLIPMIPFIIYDIGHGYKQTIGFLLWVLYRIIKLPLAVIHPAFQSSGSNPSTIPQFLQYYQQLIFAYSGTISFIGILLTLLFIYVYLRRNLEIRKIDIFSFMGIKKVFRKRLDVGHILLFLFFSIGSIGLFVHRVPIEADTLLISPFLIILFGLSLLWVFKNNFFSVFLVCILIASFNVIFLLSTNYMTNMGESSRITFTKRMVAVERIIDISKGKPYTIEGKGELSDFPVFLMPYEYLLWWKGSPPAHSGKAIIIEERNGNIYIKSK